VEKQLATRNDSTGRNILATQQPGSWQLITQQPGDSLEGFQHTTGRNNTTISAGSSGLAQHNNLWSVEDNRR
jgi:hypothetical protein